MPFKWGIYYVAFFVAVTFLGFWRTYFAPIGTVPLAFHMHAISALAWLALLAAQIWSIHNRRNDLHKTLGKASFALFPFLILGLVMIVNVTATRYLAGDEGRTVLGPTVGAITFVAIFAYLALFYLAMRHRRTIKLHAGYLLATPLILFESPAGRASGQYLGWPDFADRTRLQQFGDSIASHDAIAIAFALVMYFSDRKHGAPWLVVSGFMLLQAVTVYNTDAIPGFTPLFEAYGRLPPAVTITGALAAGALVGWLGWQHGKAPVRRTPEPQPAE